MEFFYICSNPQDRKRALRADRMAASLPTAWALRARPKTDVAEVYPELCEETTSVASIRS